MTGWVYFEGNRQRVKAVQEPKYLIVNLTCKYNKFRLFTNLIVPHGEIRKDEVFVRFAEKI